MTRHKCKVGQLMDFAPPDRAYQRRAGSTRSFDFFRSRAESFSTA